MTPVPNVCSRHLQLYRQSYAPAKAPVIQKAPFDNWTKCSKPTSLPSHHFHWFFTNGRVAFGCQSKWLWRSASQYVPPLFYSVGSISDCDRGPVLGYWDASLSPSIIAHSSSPHRPRYKFVTSITTCPSTTRTSGSPASRVSCCQSMSVDRVWALASWHFSPRADQVTPLLCSRFICLVSQVLWSPIRRWSVVYQSLQMTLLWQWLLFWLGYTLQKPQLTELSTLQKQGYTLIPVV